MSGPVVSVTHHGVLIGESNLLNTRIEQFHVGQTSMYEASLALYLHLYFALNPKSTGIVGDFPAGNPAFLVGPFDLKNATGQGHPQPDRFAAQQWCVGRPATVVDDGERPRLWLEGAGVRQDGC